MKFVTYTYFALIVALGCLSHAGSTTYTYDPRGDLVSAAYSAGPSMAYVYDALGNRLSETVTLAPTAQNSIASVAYNASAVPLTSSIGGNATSLRITVNPAHGSASVSGLAVGRDDG